LFIYPFWLLYYLSSQENTKIEKINKALAKWCL
jgi:hypothetical protein